MRKLLLMLIIMATFSSFALAASVTFHFTDQATLQPVDNVTAKLCLEGSTNCLTFTLNEGGSLLIDTGVWNMNFSKTGYLTTNLTVNVTGDMTLHVILVQNTTTEYVENITTIPTFTAPESALNVTRVFGKWIGGDYITHFFNMDIKGFLEDYFNNPPLPGLGLLTVLMLWLGSTIATFVYFKNPVPVWVASNIVYRGLTDFVDFSPAILFGPLLVFNVYLGYTALLALVRKLGGR